MLAILRVTKMTNDRNNKNEYLVETIVNITKINNNKK